MATLTSYLRLTKPELGDTIDPTIFSDNFDAIDTAFLENDKEISDIKTQISAINKSIDSSAIQVYISSTMSPMPTSASKVTLGNTQAKIGSNLAAYNGGVKCGKAGFVCITCGMALGDSFSNGDLVHLLVYKNSSSVSDMFYRLKSDGWECFTTSELMLKVAAGDVLYYYAYNQISGRGTLYKQNNSTSMSVRYI